MRLEYSKFVERDLEGIAEFIGRHNSARATTFVAEILDHFQIVLRAPLAFRIRRDIAPNARAAVHGQYLILFELMDDVVRIQRIVHGRRKLGSLYASAAERQ